MTAPLNITYTILDIDMDGARVSSMKEPVNHTVLRGLAARFNISVPPTSGGAGWAPPWLSIWIASSKDDKFKNSTIEWFTDNVAEGDTVQIPYAGDAWEWRATPVKAATLAELCDQDMKKPDPLRIGGPALTPKLLYFHIFNEAYRNLYTKRLPPGSRRNPDMDPGSLRFEKGDELVLPYPIRRKGVVLSATPSNGTTPSATAALAPVWVIQFYDLLNAIDEKAFELAKVNKLCLSCQQQGSQAWSHIMVLHELVRLQLSTTDHPSAMLGKLEHLLDQLENQTMTTLFVNVAAIAVPEANNKRKVLADELVALMAMDRPAQRSGELSRRDLEARLGASPRERINKDELLMDMKVRVLARATVALAASPRAEVAHATADQVMKELGLAAAAAAAAPEQGSAAIGATTTLVSTSVGNLPGPSTLAVVFVWLRASRKVTEVARAAVDPTKSVAVPQNLLDEMQIAIGYEEAQKLAAASASTNAALVEAGAALGARLEGKSPGISDAVAGNFMVGMGWNIGVTLVNMLALINTCQSEDAIRPRKELNIVGGAYGTSLGVLRVLASLYRGGLLEKAFDALGDRFGIVGVVASTLSGTITAFAGETVGERVGGGFQAAGGVFSLVGFAVGSGPFGFVLLGIGGGCMIVSVAASNWDNVSNEVDRLKRHIDIGPKVVLREQLTRFLSFSIVQQAGSSLVSEVKEILNQLESSHDAGLHEFERTDVIVSLLRSLRFAEGDIDLMTYTGYPVLSSPTVGF